MLVRQMAEQTAAAALVNQPNSSGNCLNPQARLFGVKIIWSMRQPFEGGAL
jgi:hypothetical protein